MDENTLLRKLQRALQRADRAEESLRQQQVRNLYLTHRNKHLEARLSRVEAQRKEMTMGMMISHLSELDDLHFNPFPARPVALAKCVRVGRQIIGVGEKGTLYATGRLGENAAFLPSEWNFMDDALKALVKLKLITQEVADAHHKRCREVDARRDAQSDLKHTLPKLEKRYGFAFTKAQRAKIEQHASL